MNYVVVSFYTQGSSYAKRAQYLKESLDLFNIPFDIQGIPNQGDWARNCGFKPEYIRAMMKKYPSKNIVWIDADAIVRQEPKLFSNIKEDIAVHYRDGKELLSGTIFIRNNEKMMSIVSQWRRLCRASPKKWDQKVLDSLLSLNRYNIEVKRLPPQYTQIFDTMAKHGQPVIEHFQESRNVNRLPSRIVVDGHSFRTVKNVIFLPRKDKKLEAILDKYYDRVKPLQWSPDARKNNIQELANKYKGKGCYIIGKGPSIDNLTEEHFKEDWPVFCINESIKKIDDININNPIYVVQQDVGLQETCRSSREATYLLASRVAHLYEDCETKKYSIGQFGLGEKAYTVIITIRIARMLGCTPMKLYGFDAVTHGDCTYADTIGYPSTEGGNPNRFLRHASLIKAENKNDIEIMPLN